MIGINSNGAPVIEVPAKLSGIIGAAKRRFVEFNEATGELRPLRKIYPGFRLYAKGLEDVRSLRRLCEEQGIQARSNEDRIHGVLSLDAALGKFLAFIVIAGGVGGAGALFTSLYLSIERSRRQFAVLQILGISRVYVLSAVLIQAVIMVVLGFLLSFVLFQIGAKLLASVIGVDPEPGTAVCRLDASQWMLLLGITLTIAVGSGFVAIARLRFRDPAIVARSE
jgi:putative ABC transport system permease protein